MVWVLSLTQTDIGASLAVTVPEVKNMTWEDGSAQLISDKLVPERINETSDTIVEGAILRTEPASGEKVSPQTPIKVFVSSGAPKESVPQLVGLDQASAEAKLVELGFVVGTISSAHSSTIPLGVVMATDPGAPNEASLGTAVNLTISDGLVTIPDVTNKAIGEATALLSALQLEVITQADMGCSGGLVSGQSISGDQAQKSRVTITYCGAA
jgi:eukaryotic-like serine/threonine-protein kinase